VFDLGEMVGDGDYLKYLLHGLFIWRVGNGVRSLPTQFWLLLDVGGERR